MIENHTHVHYIQQGVGRPVILIHGIASSTNAWQSLIPPLVEVGLSSYAIDLPGHGESIKPIEQTQYQAEQISDTLEIWLTEHNFNQPIILISHSMGSYFSIDYALKFPKHVAALVLINPFYSLEQLASPVRLMLRYPHLSAKGLKVIPEWLIQIVVGLDVNERCKLDQHIRQQIAFDYKRASPNIYRIPASLTDLTPSLGSINIPTQIIWGRRDLTLMPESFEYMTSLMPLAEGYAIPDCGHLPHIGNPILVNQLIIDFLIKHNLA
jgi:pimeloyl-ACP methyl ester carboxylesterase